MFAADEVKVEAPYDSAVARLLHLINSGAVHEVCDAAYEGGLRRTVRVGPFGAAPGLSKLVLVRTLAPVCRDAMVTVSLRWEATGTAGDLFPVLDADLTLTVESENRSRLKLIGSYRPPLGRAGAALDRVVMGRVAAATIRSFLECTGEVLAGAPSYRQTEQDTVPRWRPIPES